MHCLRRPESMGILMEQHVEDNRLTSKHCSEKYHSEKNIMKYDTLSPLSDGVHITGTFGESFLTSKNCRYCREKRVCDKKNYTHVFHTAKGSNKFDLGKICGR